MSRQHHDLTALQRSHDFQIIDQKVQELIANISQGTTSFEELRLPLQEDGVKTREHITKEFQEQERQRHIRERRRQVLDSLWFNEIHSREERIVDAHRRTFEWIFDDSGRGVRPWDNFVQWLEQGQGVYWIHGKAGSGKSTLMSFLCQHDRTMRSLKIWSGNKDVFMPKFFFWRGGTTMEKSVEGLLRSLVWQMLNQIPETSWNIESFLEHLATGQHSNNLIAAWTERRLRDTLSHVLQLASNSSYLCLFIDGLDEFEKDPHDLIDLIRDQVKGTKVKLCLSSRADPPFERAFGSANKLRLQDLTRGDIHKFATDKLHEDLKARSHMLWDQDWAGRLVTELVSRAEGVFLWVSLAVKDLVRGLEDDDSPEQLKQRLSILPGEIEGIYANMLKQIDVVHWEEASRYLQVAVQRPGTSLVLFILASSKEVDEILNNPDKFPEMELVEISRRTQSRIKSTCVGFLEIHKYRKAYDDISYKSKINIRGEITDPQMFAFECNNKVDWIHRTALDFMKAPARKQMLSSSNNSSVFDTEISYVKALLAEARLFGLQHLCSLQHLIVQICDVVLRTEEVQTDSLELLDLTMSRIDRYDPEWSPNSHWCTRSHWGDHNTYGTHWLQPVTETNISSSSHDSNHSFCSREDCGDMTTVSRVPSHEPLDFLGFAASWNFPRYVLDTIQSQKRTFNQELAEYLLCCYLWPSSTFTMFNRCVTHQAEIDLVAECLRRDANPNARTSMSTLWGSFLWNLLFRYEHCIGKPHLVSAVQCALLFVEHGATADGDWTLRTPVTVSWLKLSKSAKKKTHCDMKLSLRLSTITVLETCLGHQPDFPRLRDICVAKGARYYARCEILEVRCKVDHPWEIRYRLSEEGSTTMLILWREICDRGAVLNKEYKEWRHRVDKFVQELGDGDHGTLIESSRPDSVPSDEESSSSPSADSDAYSFDSATLSNESSSDNMT